MVGSEAPAEIQRHAAQHAIALDQLDQEDAREKNSYVTPEPVARFRKASSSMVSE
jgi:hypothetical protein